MMIDTAEKRHNRRARAQKSPDNANSIATSAPRNRAPKGSGALDPCLSAAGCDGNACPLYPRLENHALLPALPFPLVEDAQLFTRQSRNVRAQSANTGFPLFRRVKSIHLDMLLPGPF